LASADAELLASAEAGADSVVRLAATRGPGERAPRASISLREELARSERVQALRARADRGEPPENAGVSIWRQRLEGRGALLLGARATGLAAAPRLGASGFLASRDGGCLLVDASELWRPVVGAHWDIPGVTGAVPSRVAVLAFGPGGLFTIHGADAGARIERIGSEPVLAASSDGDQVAVAFADRVELLNAYGSVVGRIATEEPPVGLLAGDGQVLLSSTSRMAVFAVGDHDGPQQVEEHDALGGLRLMRSGLGGGVFGVRADNTTAELRRTERGWTTAAVHRRRPWQADAALSGTTLAHLGDGMRVNVFRQQSPPQLVSPGER
jgi:hypothetical protein